ncbi:hypothetical protein H5P28_16735 [Ruficoccus amylovorans]|uniref:Xylulokinase n=1 Tax=Ruficoccus amylovorans TaxID=1804625 RepID=A0A842HHB2_9BACT|nr:FGGY-family carbohydrate kinase [Ruficoccus amylovorans]MBC2595913.1 hypothetical protein [Ruficoccus amylovorans]
MSTLGLDVGTSGCKAVVFSARGEPLAEAARAYAVESPRPGWAELDPQLVGARCLEVIREVASRCTDDPVDALAVSSQGEAFTGVDAKGRPLFNAMVSSDSRALEQVNACEIDGLYETTGHTPYPIFSLFKLLWLRRERPDVWRQVARFLCFEDYVHYCLGVEPAISYSLATRTMLFNVRQACWDAGLLEACGIHEAQLSRPLSSGEVVGVIPKALCRELHLASGAVVVTGGHDQVCAALGCGAVRSGIAALGSGTVECIIASFSHPVMKPALRDNNLCTYAHAMPGLYATLAYNLSGGNVLQWYCRQWLNETPSEPAYERMLAEMPAAPTGLMVLPYFTGSGTPRFDGQTPAAILGLRLGTHRGEILKALLEGLCFELESNLRILDGAGLSVDELRVVGGGAKNRRWLQIKADVFNLPVSVPQVTQAGCLGVALLARAARYHEPLEALAAEWIRPGETLLPCPERVSFYRERATLYGEAYASLCELSKKLF